MMNLNRFYILGTGIFCLAVIILFVINTYVTPFVFTSSLDEQKREQLKKDVPIALVFLCLIALPILGIGIKQAIYGIPVTDDKINDK